MTIVVGLHALKVEPIVVPADIPAVWDPIDHKRSSERSEAFALQGAVVFMATALDQYLADAAALMRPVSPSLTSALEAASANRGGLRGKARAFAAFSGANQTAELALVECALQWRNRLVHPNSQARFNRELRDELISHAPEFGTDYRHLDPEQLIRAFDQGKPAPSFKEVAGMITAAHRYVHRVDTAVLENLNYEQYLEDALRRHLQDVTRKEAQERANRIWGRTEQRAHQAIVALAKQNGFTEATEDSTRGLTAETITRLAGLTARAAMHTFSSTVDASSRESGTQGPRA